MLLQRLTHTHSTHAERERIHTDAHSDRRTYIGASVFGGNIASEARTRDNYIVYDACETEIYVQIAINVATHNQFGSQPASQPATRRATYVCMYTIHHEPTNTFIHTRTWESIAQAPMYSTNEPTNERTTELAIHNMTEESVTCI